MYRLRQADDDVDKEHEAKIERRRDQPHAEHPQGGDDLPAEGWRLLHLGGGHLEDEAQSQSGSSHGGQPADEPQPPPTVASHADDPSQQQEGPEQRLTGDKDGSKTGQAPGLHEPGCVRDEPQQAASHPREDQQQPDHSQRGSGPGVQRPESVHPIRPPIPSPPTVEALPAAKAGPTAHAAMRLSA